MSTENLGNVVGVVKSVTAPSKTYVLWAKIIDATYPDEVEIRKYNPTINDWEPLNGTTWLPSVNDYNINTPAVSPTLGDAYLIGAAPTGVWTGKANNYAVWLGHNWSYITPSNGATAKKKNSPTIQYTYNASVPSWGLAIAGGMYAGAHPSNVVWGAIPVGTDLTGKTTDQIIEMATVTYFEPIFTAGPTFTGQATVVELGTTLSGSKTVTWTIDPRSGTVTLVDIYDNTAGAALVTNTPNDGSQAVTITTIQLNAAGATQSWKMIAHNSGNGHNIDSSNFIVTARPLLWFGPVSANPTNSAQVRALPSNAFYTGAMTVQLNTGTVENHFPISIPASSSLGSAIDIDSLGADITSNFILTGTFNVLDAGGTNRSYKTYVYNPAVAYGVNHRINLTIS